MSMNHTHPRLLTLGLVGAVFAVLPQTASAANRVKEVIVGNDKNNETNAFVQPQNPALSGGGRDQTLKFGDRLEGSTQTDLIIGGLGTDTINGRNGADILIGGPEHFNPENRDRAFGENGADIFIWKPGDGSDFFDGGPGDDTVVFGLLAEEDQFGQPDFSVINDQMTGKVFRTAGDLPIVDVTNSPGFCEVIDDSSPNGAQAALDELGIDHLVRFFLRGINQSFDAGTQNTDNGLRVTLHLKDVEFLVCTTEEGGEIEAFDLRQTPPVRIRTEDLPNLVEAVIQ